MNTSPPKRECPLCRAPDPQELHRVHSWAVVLICRACGHSWNEKRRKARRGSLT